jgi:hypothetical protein
MRMALEVSMNAPATSRSTLTRSRNISGLRSAATRLSATCRGMRSLVRTKVNRMPLAMMNITIADVRADFSSTVRSAESVSSR